MSCPQSQSWLSSYTCGEWYNWVWTSSTSVGRKIQRQHKCVDHWDTYSISSSFSMVYCWNSSSLRLISSSLVARWILFILYTHASVIQSRGLALHCRHAAAVFVTPVFHSTWENPLFPIPDISLSSPILQGLRLGEVWVRCDKICRVAYMLEVRLVCTSSIVYRYFIQWWAKVN